MYPEIETKEEVYNKSKDEFKSKQDINLIPDGTYTLNRSIRGYGRVHAVMEVEEGSLTVKSGAKCAPIARENPPKDVLNANVINNVLKDDHIFTSPSTAAYLVVGKNTNGWTDWKNENGEFIDIYRKKQRD
ncbi:DUF4357 domain-containing protein [uncultured Anaerococcus sp.]|uniref:DUF4357 domain-containing protein n=1 Tax=uncultured Anaerococcus sp. TaxID=293428 RepID=UPI0026158F5B|nr:DUF4357 domain-containing protein [uncultured Anaerococcus sp.]